MRGVRCGDWRWIVRSKRVRTQGSEGISLTNGETTDTEA